MCFKAVRKFLFFFFKYPWLLVAFGIWCSSCFLSSAIEQSHQVSLLLQLDADINSQIQEEGLKALLPPIYTHMHKVPGLTIRSYNDLIGNIHIYELRDLEKLERVYYYLMIDYAVVSVYTNFVCPGGTIPPSEEHCALIFRTLIEYRDQEWQSANVRSIHEALIMLNKEMLKLLVFYYSLEELNIMYLAQKDLNMFLLKHSSLAEALGLSPADFAWGRFIPGGLDELKKVQDWDEYRKLKIKGEMKFEFFFMDIDIMMNYIDLKMRENIDAFNNFMAQKLALEKLDLEILGKKDLSYQEIVHYRVFGGEETLFQYGFARSSIDGVVVKERDDLFRREFTSYKWSFDPDLHKGFYEELRDKVNHDLEVKRATHRSRFFLKK